MAGFFLHLPGVCREVTVMVVQTAYGLHDPNEGNALTHVIFCSPHSGRRYPRSLTDRSRLSLPLLRTSEDAYVDRLFASAPQFGAPLLFAHTARAFVDLNRAPDELDPALIKGIEGPGANQRVLAGLGVVPRVVAEGRQIYDDRFGGKITLQEAHDRIARIHAPFHRKLESLVLRARESFGAALLIDCHSTPHEALCTAPKIRGRAPQIVLGDRFGASAGEAFMFEVQAAFERAGFTVVRNAPFAGGYISQRYGRPSRGLHAIQVEIDRRLYLDPDRVAPGQEFDEIRQRLTEVVAEIIRPNLAAQKIAAE